MIRWFAKYRIQANNDKFDDICVDPEMVDEVDLTEVNPHEAFMKEKESNSNSDSDSSDDDDVPRGSL